METLRVACKCGWRRDEIIADRFQFMEARESLAILANRHETNTRQPHKHETTEVISLG